MASSGGYRALLVLPPDFQAPSSHRPFRFPHQGPAIVAAAVARDGIACLAADLDLDLDSRPLRSDPRLLEDEARLHEHLTGTPQEDFVALGRELIDRMEDTEVDAFALSIDRHTQVNVSLLLSVELKRRFGKPILIGGANAGAVGQKLAGLRANGIDLITGSETPDEIRASFAALRAIPTGRWGLPHEPVEGDLTTPPDDWPVPDFSIYDLNRYRRDPFVPRGSSPLSAYDGSMGRHLMLPYNFSWDCQYACTFCARSGTQSVKSNQRAVRDLATLAERYGTTDFMFFDAQINLFADEFSRELIASKVDIHWTDSFRVAPRRPREVLETMARAGCVGLTFGVESFSDRILKKMVKGHSAAQAAAVLRDAHAAEMFNRVNLLPCFPGETKEDHAISVRITEELAPYIDEVVPSSFYMASNSPILEKPERYGVAVRGEREVDGEYKFRKNHGSLTYDEVGGLTWEEREATLRPAEAELRAAWARGRSTPALTQPSQIFALRTRWGTKADCYSALSRWGGMLPRDQELSQGYDAGISSEGLDYRPDRLSPEEQTAPDSARGRALTSATDAVAALQLSLAALPSDRSTVSFKLSDSTQTTLSVHLERVREEGRYFQKGTRLGLWYARDSAASGGEPKWTGAALKLLASTLLPLDGLADELLPRTTTALPIARPGAVPKATSAKPFPQYSVFDLVLRGVKPAGSLLVPSESAAPEVVRQLPARQLSTFGFARDGRDNLQFISDPVPGQAMRMLYAGTDSRALRRLEELERALYEQRGAASALIAATQEEVGRLLGFPDCCVQAFARGVRESGQRHGDLYASLLRPGWPGAAVDWRLNHIVARQYALPFLTHEPCTPDCAPTAALVEKILAALYSPDERRTVVDILKLGAVVFADDRVLLFEQTGNADPTGTVEVKRFNQDPSLHVLGSTRPPERRVVADACGFRDVEVRRLRARDGRVEAEVSSGWRSLTLSTGSAAAPLLYLTMTPGPVSERSASTAVFASPAA